MSDRLRSRLVTAAVFAGIGVLIAIGWANRDRIRAVRTGAEVPAYAAPTLAGDTLSLADLRGSVVLLNVWATWCQPCVWEMPALERVYDELHADGFEVVAVSVDRSIGLDGPAAADRVREFVDTHGLTFSVLHDPDGRIEDVLDVHALPMTFLIDRDGRIRERVLGAAPWDEGEHRERIRRLLEE